VASQLKTLTLRSFRGFTLIELLIVIAIIFILGALALPVFTSVMDRAKATKDMSNLRQIGMATQLYMNDNSGILFSTTNGSWMSQLYSVNPATPKYLSSWNVFISPFDHPVSPRTTADNNASSAVSYGINATAGVVGISADRISKPTVFIVFAPAQAQGAAVNFQGIGNTTSQANLVSSPNITVVGATSNPGNRTATGGTHNNRTKINALCADWHVQTMYWSGTGPAFTNQTATANDPDGGNRWTP
jgi:prepilin-type N-terminal cleavage/methylation domain-containing protein